MIQAWRAFLQAGYYQPSSQEVTNCFNRFLPMEAKYLLDIDCGEGSYTTRLRKGLLESYQQLRLYGLDFAKNAIKR